MFTLAALNEIHFLAWTDPEFLAKLRANPTQVLSEFASSNENREIVLVEDSQSEVSLVFPFGQQ
jgi:hypothetical protein